MEAITAYDESGVEYHFECTSHPAYSSEWQDSPEYETDPLPDGMYSFVVRARDKSPNQNTTDPSIPPVTADLQPPEPNPMQWEKPHETYGGGGKWDYYAEMTAVEATDPSGGVKYYFQCKSDSGFDSGWQSSRTYKVLLGRSGLAYRFRVKACDAYGNETAYSEEWPAL